MPLNRVAAPRRSTFLFTLDGSLFVFVIMLLSPRASGLKVHEWLGVAFGGTAVLHLLLSWSWIGAATSRLLTAGHSRTRVNYLLNSLLFVAAVLEVVSGLVISQVALPSLHVGTIDDGTWRALHNQVSTWMMFLVGLHIAMNWQWIAVAWRRYVLRRIGANDV